MSGLVCVTTLIYDDAPSCYQTIHSTFTHTADTDHTDMSVGYEAGKMDVVFVRLI